MYNIKNQSVAIRQIQSFLLELHYAGADIPFVTIDGIYDPTTRQGVSKFQESIGLPITGTVDYFTWTRLYEAYRKAYEARSFPATIPPDTPFPVTIGASGEGVGNLQRLLNALAKRYGLPVTADENGIYSYSSAALVEALQEIYGETPNGIVTAPLFEKMLRDYNYPTPL
jgi:peptidoglycan hydrolase-like protein with peptidoglycan-binding domain